MCGDIPNTAYPVPLLGLVSFWIPRDIFFIIVDLRDGIRSTLSTCARYFETVGKAT